MDKTLEEKLAEQRDQELIMTKQWLSQSQAFVESLKESLDAQADKIEALVESASRQQDTIEELNEEKEDLLNRIKELEEKLSKQKPTEKAVTPKSAEDLIKKAEYDKSKAERKSKTAIEIGDEGEDKTTAAVKRMSDIGYPIHNLRFYYGRYKFTVEVDNVFVCNRGVFVFETKNWGAEISGKVDDTFWHYKNIRMERDIYSPIEQNDTHIRQIGVVSHLIGQATFHNVIVFPGTTTFKLDRMEDFFLKPEEIRDYIESKPVIYNELQTKDIYNKINGISQPITHEEHMKNIEERKKYKL
jgi:hypothetical protein